MQAFLAELKTTVHKLFLNDPKSIWRIRQNVLIPHLLNSLLSLSFREVDISVVSLKLAHTGFYSTKWNATTLPLSHDIVLRLQKNNVNIFYRAKTSRDSERP